MTTSDIDDQLRLHYASFHCGHVLLRERLLDDLRTQSARASQPSRLFNRRLLMRLSAAAIVVLAIGITVFLVTPGMQGTTWAEVVKTIGPIESVQYRTTSTTDGLFAAGTSMNYVTAEATRVDTWNEESRTDVVPDTKSPAPGTPSQTTIHLTQGFEAVVYDVAFKDGRINSIAQSIDYTSKSVPLPRQFRPGFQAMEMWRQLTDLPPEAVLKRGSEEVNGQRLLRFEVIDGASIAGLGGTGSATFILVDPRTKQPVELQAGATRWTDIRFNETIAAERFAAPAVPEDLDAEVSWRFTLLADAWHKEGFAFRVLDPEGKPIITDEDVETEQAPAGGYVGSRGFAPDSALPGEAEEPQNAITSAYGSLSRGGIDKLDRFMARNPGAEMTIEITGEPPIKRKVFGRLSRRPEAHWGHVVSFSLPSLADVKAATQAAPAPPLGFEGIGPGRVLKSGPATD